MPKVKCPLPGCDYETDDLSDIVVSTLLSLHGQIHAVSTPTPTTRPSKRAKITKTTSSKKAAPPAEKEKPIKKEKGTESESPEATPSKNNVVEKRERGESTDEHGNRIWKVDARLDCRKNKAQYIVTEEELKRRKLENFSPSTYNTYLRRSHSYGLASLPEVCQPIRKEGRKKNIVTQLTRFTPLVEGECEDMAEDFKTIIANSDLKNQMLDGVEQGGKYRDQVKSILMNTNLAVQGSEPDCKTHGFLGAVLPFIIECLRP